MMLAAINIRTPRRTCARRDPVMIVAGFTTFSP
jgi:hypothetical protein